MTGFQAYETIAGSPASGLVILGDHAMNRVPEEYGDLGLPASAFERHIAYDIGIEGLTRKLADALDAPAVMACFSRLLIDPNRGEDDPTLIMKLSDGAVIPANHPLSGEERERRLDRYHRPYHAAIDATLTELTRLAGRPPLVISLHSFTPLWKGVPRPWHAGLLWDSDPRATLPLLEQLRAIDDLVIGDNEPYDGALYGDTMHSHCSTKGIAHALIEVRQDLIGDERGIARWSDILAPILRDLSARDDLHEIVHHGSRAR